MKRRFWALALDDEDVAKIGRVLGQSDLELHGDYLVGQAEEAALKRLLDDGVLLDVEPDETFHELPVPPVPLSTFSDGQGAAPHAGGRPVEYRVVRLTAPLNPAREAALANMGISVGRRLGRATFQVEVDPGRLPDATPAWLDMSPYGLKATLGEDLLHAVTRPDSVPTGRTGAQMRPLDVTDFLRTPLPPAEPVGEPVVYDLRCHSNDSLPAVADLLRAMPGVLGVEVGEDRLRFKVTPAGEAVTVIGLGALDKVAAVERYVSPELLLSFAAEAVVGQGARPADLPWKGRGQVIGVADSGVDAEHPDLAGRTAVVLRVTPQSPRDPRGHGTHVASIAAGSGAASGGQLAGLAPQARLFVQSLADETMHFRMEVGLKGLLREAYDNGVRIQNYSWGSAVGGLYTMDADDLDTFVHQHPDMLVVVACGNSGVQSGPEDLSGRITLRSLASPASAKNCLSVGATCSPRPDGPYEGKTWSAYDGQRPPRRPPMSDLPLTGDVDVVAALSSRGPSDDGRIKPDLLAPGVGIAAARSADFEPRHPHPGFDDRYHFSSGTSTAAPLMAGAAAALRQFFIEDCNHAPSAALLRATLVNGASWVSGPLFEDPDIGQPNFHQGFGRFELGRALPLVGTGLRLEFADVTSAAPEAVHNAIAPSRWTQALRVQAGQPLSITLAWTDPPGRGLEHTLDLVVVSPSAARHVGNAELRRLPFETFDNRNNVQQVRVADPEPGDWAVHVIARNTRLGRQGFAVAMTVVT